MAKADSTTEGIQIRFDGSPGPVAPRFIETETLDGRGVSFGTWMPAGDDSGHWFLRLPPWGARTSPLDPEAIAARELSALGSCGPKEMNHVELRAWLADLIRRVAEAAL